LKSQRFLFSNACITHSFRIFFLGCLYASSVSMKAFSSIFGGVYWAMYFPPIGGLNLRAFKLLFTHGHTKCLGKIRPIGGHALTWSFGIHNSFVSLPYHLNRFNTFIKGKILLGLRSWCNDQGSIIRVDLWLWIRQWKHMFERLIYLTYWWMTFGPTLINTC